MPAVVGGTLISFCMGPSWTQSGPAGGFAVRVRMHGGTNPLEGALGKGDKFTGLPGLAATVRLPLGGL
jgi:hypothetical protein